MKNKYARYSLLLLLLIAVHALLQGVWAFAGWFATGIALSVFFKERFVWLHVLLLEILIAVFYRVFLWNNDGNVSNLVINTGLPAFYWYATGMIVNVITAFLCIITSFYSTRLVRQWNRKKHLEVPVAYADDHQLINQ